MPPGYGLTGLTGEGRRTGVEEEAAMVVLWEVETDKEEEEEEEEEEEKAAAEPSKLLEVNAAAVADEAGMPWRAGHTTAAPPAECTIGTATRAAVPSAMLVKRVREASAADEEKSKTARFISRRCTTAAESPVELIELA